MNLIAWNKLTDIAVVPAREPNEGEWHLNTETGVKKEYHAGTISLSVAKIDRIARIKVEAKERLSATDEELSELNERRGRGNKPQSDVDAVLDAREVIYVSREEAILAVNLLTTVEEVNAFTW